MQPPPAPALFDQFAHGWRGYLLIALIALASAAFGATRMQVMDADEARFAQASRQMVESGDFIRIQIQDEERNNKPVGVHWLQAAAVNFLKPLEGGSTNEIWMYRLPSALGLMLAALATLWGGVVLVGRRAAFFGAALLAAGMLASFEGMTAKTDALLLGFTTLAMASMARLRIGVGPPRLLALVFWLAIGCGMMIKGPVTPLTAGLALLTLWLWERRAGWMKPLIWPPGPALALLIIAPWSIAVSIKTEGRFFAEMVFGDLLPKLISGHEDHFALPGYHTFLLPFLIFPATYALPAAGRLAWQAVRAPRTDAEHAGARVLLAWAVPIFLFFELAPTKLAHYVLPAYPAIALMCGLGLIVMRRWRSAAPAGVVLFSVCGAALVSVLAAAATFMPGDFSSDLRRALSSALVGVLVVALSAAGLILLRRPAVRAAILVGCALVLSFSLRERLLPEARSLNVSNEAVAALTRARLTPRDERPLWVVGYREPSLIFLTRTSIRLVNPREAAQRAEIGDGLVIEGRVLQETTAELAQRGLVFEPSEPPVRGFATGRGERVALFVGTLAPAANAAPADDQPRNP